MADHGHGPPDPDPDPHAHGLLLLSTPTIRDFLRSHQTFPPLPDAVDYGDFHRNNAVPYKLLRDAWIHASPSSGRPSFRHLLSGSSIVFVSPRPREKSDELKERLTKLQEIADTKTYNELIKDVAWNQREEPEYFSSYKEQLGFGLHVIVIMFTGYLVGHAFFRSQLGGSPVLHAAGGILGMVIGMLVETLLFIIRTSDLDGKKGKTKKTRHGSRYKKDQ